jgi:hypothetical protein
VVGGLDGLGPGDLADADPQASGEDGSGADEEVLAAARAAAAGGGGFLHVGAGDGVGVLLLAVVDDGGQGGAQAVLDEVLVVVDAGVDLGLAGLLGGGLGLLGVLVGLVEGLLLLEGQLGLLDLEFLRAEFVGGDGVGVVLPGDEGGAGEDDAADGQGGLPAPGQAGLGALAGDGVGGDVRVGPVRRIGRWWGAGSRRCGSRR